MQRIKIERLWKDRIYLSVKSILSNQKICLANRKIFLGNTNRKKFYILENWISWNKIKFYGIEN